MESDNQELYTLKFNKFKKKLLKLQRTLTTKEKIHLYENSNDDFGKHIFNNFIDLEFGLIEFE